MQSKLFYLNIFEFDIEYSSITGSRLTETLRLGHFRQDLCTEYVKELYKNYKNFKIVKTTSKHSQCQIDLEDLKNSEVKLNQCKGE